MKANELRLGNLYNQFGNIHQVNGHIISELEKAPQGQLWCKPIPLTEEWLIKFGFEETDPITFMGGLYSIKKPDGFYINKETMSYCTFDYEGTIDDIIKIEYVHQLQNLYFAVTGEELTMK